MPFGLTAPIPVMTTRRIELALFDPTLLWSNRQYRLNHMETATEKQRAGTLSAVLAGLQAGMLGACWMLAWLGISAKWQLRSFWTAENLMASVFYGDRAIRSGFAERTLSGLALYLLLYSSLGALFAVLVTDRLPRFRLVVVSVLFAMCWYY